MPKCSTKFREDWLSLVDKNGSMCSDWCTKGKVEYSAYCFLCKATVNIGNSGKIQLMQHANTAKHKSLDAARKDTSQSRFVNNPGSKSVHLLTKEEDSSEKISKQTWVLNEEDRICRSEILWTIHVALNNYSFLSCDTIKSVFAEMFPDSSLPKSVQLCSRKVAYTVSHGLGPYFMKQIADEFHHKSPFFTLMFDETLNEQNLKQLDVHIRYWNTKEESIAERYLGSELLGHATALNIYSGILSILKSCDIGLKGLLMLGSDGPNVNKSVFQLMNKEVNLLRNSGLVNIGTCNLHVIHNSFGNGLKIEAFANLTDFFENIHRWFAKFPSRQEDLRKSMENFDSEFSKVLRYVSNRWLSVVQVCERTVKLLPQLKKYFLEDLHKEKSKLVKHDRYVSISKILKSELTPVYLNFLISVGGIFEEILTLLQKKTTLIHVLHDELSKILIKLMRRFVNEDVVRNKTGAQLLDIDVRKEAVSVKCIDVGNSTKKHMNELNHSALKAEFLSDAKEFYIAVTIYLQERLPLNNKLLQNLQILHPIVRKESFKTTLSLVRQLCNILPQVISEDCVDRVTDEWTLYVNDPDICEEWSLKPIDTFWSHVFALKNVNELPRYPYMMRLVKAVLTFSHGQATVERGFSVNKRTVSAERASMSLDTIRGLRMIKDAVRGKASDVCITQEMIKFCKDAYSKYKAQKDAEKRKEETKCEPKISDVTVVKGKLTNIKGNISSAQCMINEGNERLKTGLKRKCMKEIEIAQALIDAGHKKLKTANEEVNKE